MVHPTLRLLQPQLPHHQASQRLLKSHPPRTLRWTGGSTGKESPRMMVLLPLADSIDLVSKSYNSLSELGCVGLVTRSVESEDTQIFQADNAPP